jgi:hypothetical protein
MFGAVMAGRLLAAVWHDEKSKQSSLLKFHHACASATGTSTTGHLGAAWMTPQRHRRLA